ncbi:MAG TPA: choice-of-anchor Q domain-containing protein [Puia sp.]|nr:choice-of-anchor Q domain-containing protein [Puia sp.]
MIGNISLAGGTNSPFKLNINGSPGPDASGLTLEGGDSLYLFISVYIPAGTDPQAFILRDSIQVHYNNLDRYIQLSAWGQNAHFLKNETIQSAVVWNNDMPYVISGGLHVDSNAVLTINAGCRIYLHADAAVLIDGTLIANGGAADSTRVYFTGDRLDEPYASFPGSWPGLYFTAASQNNHLQYTVVQNAYQSVASVGPSTNASPKLVLDQCIINNSSDAGILAVQSSVDANNCLISNCGKNIEIVGGGTYHFTNCTAASYSNALLQHQSPVLSVSDEGTVDGQLISGDLLAAFTNCILWGDANIDDEAQVSHQATGAFYLLFDHLILKQKNYPGNTDSVAVLLNADPLFSQIDNTKRLYDFHLQAGSPAIGFGTDPGLTIDLDGNARPVGKQDLGCYERQ